MYSGQWSKSGSNAKNADQRSADRRFLLLSEPLYGVRESLTSLNNLR